MMFKKTTYKIILPVFFAAVVFILIAAHNTSAQATPLLNFIGKVTNTDGSEVADGTYDFSFGLYTAPTGGAAIWSEDLTAATRFSGTISGAVEGANSITYTYTGEAATSTFRLGQYLYNASTSAAALIIAYDTSINTVTVASGSPLWVNNQGINNRPFVEGGVININLGSVADLSSVDFNQTLYLEIAFNSETMQPRKLLTTEAHAFDAARLGGRAASEYAALPEDETVTGEWSFNNIVSMATSASDTVLTVAQNGSGNIVDFRLGTTTALAVLDDGRVQIGDYYFPASRAGSNAGYVLKVDALGNLSWANDLAGSGGGSGLWASTSVGADTFVYQSDSGDIVVVGNNATSSPYGSKLDVTGDAWFDNILVSDQQQVRFYDVSSSYYMAIRASTSMASNFILTLPDSAGTPGQALLTDGSGNLSWGAPSGGTVYVNPGAVGQLGYYASAGSTLTATSSIFLSSAGYFGIGTATPANLLSVGGISGSQFLVDSNGQVVGGTWQADIVDTAYGGTGTTTAGWTGLPFINAGAWSSTSTLSAQYGGTGFSSFSTGDLLYAGDASSYVLLPIGNESEILVVSPAGIPSWVSTTSLNLDVANMTGILNTAHGGTGQNFASSTGFIYLDNGTAIASATVAITYTDLAASSGIVLSGNMLTLDNTGNWIGTLDGIDGVDIFTLADWFSTTTAQHLLKLPNLAQVGTIAIGTWEGDVLSVGYGGTGTSTAPAYGQLLLGLASGDYDLVATSTLGLLSKATQLDDLANVSVGGKDIGDLLYWNGTAWADMATSALGLYTGEIVTGDTGWLPYYTTTNNFLSATSSIFINTNQYIGIGTTSPTAKLTVYGNLLLEGANRYINFSSSTGSTSYGLRDNSGQIQVKNKNGTWTAIGAGATDLTDLNDVNTAGVAWGNLIYYTGGATGWQEISTSSLAINLDNTRGTLAINRGGTGATTVAGARENLDLDEIYTFAINSTGTVNWIWQSDGDGRGEWVATTTLGFRSGSGSGSPASKFVGTTTLEYDGHFSSSTLEGYMAANSICDADFPGSHFCRTYDILVTIEQDDISGWGGRAWIAEGPPGFTSDSNDCNGWTTNDSDKYGAWWDFDPNGGSGWLIYCNYTRPLACCLRQ